MAGDIDPRLKAQLDAAGDDGEVEALIMLQRSAQKPRGAAPDGSGEQLISRVSHAVDEQPVEVRQFPGLGAMFVKGSGKLVRRLVQSDEVLTASANEAELTADGSPSAG